ncbi:uncharacterized protein LOC130895817 [Diorhabda carinulata]|uniref:uncharacterized protein LOC130895817 n=1 Tax=Diorhabda carinulata TaxID=1163345 RepID=UPI0025A1B293|nr:uncharacterized protein LOC130895817 [Diorhabda carinulata]
MLGNIINGGQLSIFINKNVSIIGFVTEKAPNGLWFEIRTTDNQIVRVTMKLPIDQPLDGYVEVHGVSTGKGIIADSYVGFDNDKFDAKSYNLLCTFLHSIPRLWDTEKLKESSMI